MKLFNSEKIALYEGENSITYRDLCEQASKLMVSIRSVSEVQRPLISLYLDTSANAVIAYMACLIADAPVILLGGGFNGELEAKFGVNLRILATVEGIELVRLNSIPIDLDRELAVLLTTSGSTGAAKLVKLSKQNLQSNASSIAEYLNINSSERAITSLPFYYSYGLSVLNSHLISQAAVICVKPDILSSEFWTLAKRWEASSIAGVPFTYQILCRFGLERVIPRSVKTLTQAGGKLNHSLAKQVAEFASENNLCFFIMYGQTEATARIAYLPAEDALYYADAIGQAIPGGELWLENADGKRITEQGERGELIYQGPNVMLGYASEPSDLSATAQGDILRTGDLAYLKEGRYYLCGRLKRFIKLRSRRYSLDELQAQLQTELGVDELVCYGKDDALFIACAEPLDATELNRLLRAKTIPHSLYRFMQLEQLPRTPNGKIDYPKLEAMDA